jgi:hypothetical protein
MLMGRIMGWTASRQKLPRHGGRILHHAGDRTFIFDGRLSSSAVSVARLVQLEAPRKFADDLETCEKRTLLELAQIAPADVRFVCELILRKPPAVPKTPQVCGEYFSQIHARSEANSSKYAIEQNLEKR